MDGTRTRHLAGAQATEAELVPGEPFPEEGLPVAAEIDRLGGAAFDEWVRDQVEPVLKQMRVSPQLATPAEQVFAEWRAYAAQRLGKA